MSTAHRARSLLDCGGPLERSLPGYERREGQLRMAAAVEEAFAVGDHLLVEAGTGIGKTLAYLLPAAELQEPVVISTGTRNLQDQIFFRDVPLLRDRLGLKVEATYLKGRDNYLCVHRFRDFARAPTFPQLEEIPSFQKITAWAGITDRGDRAELADVPERISFWRNINARADTCLGRKCDEYEECFLVRSRREAAEAGLIIVNHHLLLADLVVKAGDFGAILPDYRHVVVDEAHLLEDVATSYFGRRTSFFRCRELADDTVRFLKTAGIADPAVTRTAESVRLHAGDLFDSFRGDTGRKRLRPGSWDPRRSEARDRLLAALDELGSGLKLAAKANEDLRGTARRASEIAGDLRFITLEDDLEHVRWAELGPRGGSLHASPIDVSAALVEHLFSQVSSAILTSATLTVGGTFDFLRGRLGLEESRSLQVSSPFDYAAQALLYLPEGLPEPSSPAFYPQAARTVRELLEASGGRALLLFTSYAGMHRMREILDDEPHDFTVLMQGEGSRHALLDRLREGRRAVLLGTASFWQGVDVPGEALSLVVIDRLPFEVPSDPVVQSRSDRLRESGGNPFRDLQLPQAVIGLKQGAGRLIRSTADRGVLAILDPRLQRRSYGRVFLESLPPFRRTTSLDEVRRFYQAGQAPGLTTRGPTRSMDSSAREENRGEDP